MTTEQIAALHATKMLILAKSGVTPDMVVMNPTTAITLGVQDGDIVHGMVIQTDYFARTDECFIGKRDVGINFDVDLNGGADVGTDDHDPAGTA